MEKYYIIDRQHKRGASSPNRERLLQRVRGKMKQAIPKILDGNTVEGIGKDGKGIKIPVKGLREPIFSYDRRQGKHTNIYSGNDRFHTGDKVPKPLEDVGNGSGKGEGSPDGVGEDEFIIEISRDEFRDLFFSDLELPNLEEKQQQSSIDTFRMRRAGHRSDGSPPRLNIFRSMSNSIGRRRAVEKNLKKALLQAKADLHQIPSLEELLISEPSPEVLLALQKYTRVSKLQKRLDNIPFFDDIDLRYDHFEKEPLPVSSAVIFSCMDVSASMGREEKEIAQRFFWLLYLMIEANYDHTEIVWVRHHTEAKRVNEHDFFHDRETGGTVVSSALELIDNIKTYGDTLSIGGYPTNLWNIYVAQCTDGDNAYNDDERCGRFLRTILGYANYFTYTQIRSPREQNLWKLYHETAIASRNLRLCHINDKTDIYPVFRDLFTKNTKGKNS